MKKFIALLLTLLLALSAAAPALAEKQTYRSLYSGEVTTLNYLTTTTTSEFGLLSNLIDTLVGMGSFSPAWLKAGKPAPTA